MVQRRKTSGTNGKTSIQGSRWAAVNIRGKVGFHLFTENLDRHLYCKNRKSLYDRLYNNAGTVVARQWVFEQANDPKHTSKDVQADLERHLPNRVLPWPSYNPDMNPTENIWAVLKH